MRFRAFSRALPRTNASDLDLVPHPRLDFHRGARNQFSLVEAALAKLGAVQGHRDHGHGVRRKLRFERCDRLGQHSSKNIGRRAHAAILQQMNQFAQSAFVAAVSGRTRKGRFDAAAQPAPGLACGAGNRIWGKQPLAADGADSAPIACMASRHSWQTGRREIFTSGVPQMRQSEGNKTAKRLSAIWRAQLWFKPEACRLRKQ